MIRHSIAQKLQMAAGANRAPPAAFVFSGFRSF
jgi:hypothetical protein